MMFVFSWKRHVRFSKIWDSWTYKLHTRMLERLLIQNAPWNTFYLCLLSIVFREWSKTLCRKPAMSASRVRLLRNKKRSHPLPDEFGWLFPSSYDNRHCVPLKLTETRIKVDPQIVTTTKECWMPRFHLMHFTIEQKTLTPLTWTREVEFCQFCTSQKTATRINTLV